MSNAPLCKDCQWMKQVMIGRGDLLADCTNPDVMSPSYVSGRPTPRMCVIARMGRGLCGPTGRLFEPKTRPWWKFW